MLYEPANEPVHRGIVIADIEGSCRPGRTNLTLVGMSDALRRMVEEGFRRASISERQVVLKGLGDGLLALLHSDVNKPRMIEPLVPHLVSQLQARNRKVGEQSRMRLRVVVHAGEVVRCSGDYIGEDLNHAFRLVDADAVRQRLAAIQAPLVLVVSQFIYDSVVKHGYLGIDTSQFNPVHITAKETSTQAWIWIPSADR